MAKRQKLGPHAKEIRVGLGPPSCNHTCDRLGRAAKEGLGDGDERSGVRHFPCVLRQSETEKPRAGTRLDQDSVRPEFAVRQARTMRRQEPLGDVVEDVERLLAGRRGVGPHELLERPALHELGGDVVPPLGASHIEQPNQPRMIEPGRGLETLRVFFEMSRRRRALEVENPDCQRRAPIARARPVHDAPRSARQDRLELVLPKRTEERFGIFAIRLKLLVDRLLGNDGLL